MLRPHSRLRLDQTLHYFNFPGLFHRVPSTVPARYVLRPRRCTLVSNELCRVG